MELSNNCRLISPPDQIPRTSTILVIDSDIGNLNLLSPALRYLGYRVVTRQTAAEALYLLRQCSGEFDLLLTELFLPDSDRFEFLTTVTSENADLPVVSFSDDRRYADVAVQALLRGACAFYRKPIAPEILRHLWQLVFCRKIQSCRANHAPPFPALSPPVTPLAPPLAPQVVFHRKIQSCSATRRRSDAGDHAPPLRVRWTPELHSKFVEAVEAGAGEESLLPGKILERMERMGVVGLTRNQVSSHLQQYKKKAKKSAEEEQIYQSDNNNNSDTKTCSDNQEVGVLICSEQGVSDPYSSGTVSQCSEDVENGDWVSQLLRFE